MAEKSAKLRVDENGVPLLIVARQIQIICHTLKTEDEYGSEVPLKLRPSQGFLTELNEAVIDLVEQCCSNATDEKRTTLMDKDVPNLRQLLEMEELGGDQPNDPETQEVDEDGNPAWNMRKI